VGGQGQQSLSGWQKAAIVASVLAAVATLLGALQAIGVTDVFGGSDDKQAAQPTTIPKIDFPDLGGGRASLRLSRTSGPPGTTLSVSGAGFTPRERIEIRFHTERVGTAHADGNGNFEAQIQIPPDWQFRNQQFSIVAEGEASIQAADEPFDVQ
jgi:hypothetical protein